METPSTGDFDETKVDVDVLLLRLGLCESALETIIPDLYDPGHAELRADILIASESMLTKVLELVRVSRDIAWQNTKVPRGGFDEPV